MRGARLERVEDFSSLRPWDLLKRRTRKTRNAHGSERSGLPHLRCRRMPLSLQKNGEDFQWPEEPVRLLSGGNPHQARWSISAKPHAWWWWEDGVAFRVDKNGQCRCQPTNAPLRDFAEYRADFPGTSPQLLKVHPSPAAGSASWDMNLGPRWTQRSHNSPHRLGCKPPSRGVPNWRSKTG